MKFHFETKGRVRFHSETKGCVKVYSETKGCVKVYSETKGCVKVCSETKGRLEFHSETKRCVKFSLRPNGTSTERGSETLFRSEALLVCFTIRLLYLRRKICTRPIYLVVGWVKVHYCAGGGPTLIFSCTILKVG